MKRSRGRISLRQKFSVNHFGHAGRRAPIEKTGIWRLDRPPAGQPGEALAPGHGLPPLGAR
jgi:hypothetical protein